MNLSKNWKGKGIHFQEKIKIRYLEQTFGGLENLERWKIKDIGQKTFLFQNYDFL